MGRVRSIFQTGGVVYTALCHFVAIDGVSTFRSICQLWTVILANIVRDLFFKDTPWNITLVDVFIYYLGAICCGFFLCTLYGRLIPVVSIEINELVFD